MYSSTACKQQTLAHVRALHAISVNFVATHLYVFQMPNTMCCVRCSDKLSHNPIQIHTQTNVPALLGYRRPMPIKITWNEEHFFCLSCSLARSFYNNHSALYFAEMCFRKECILANISIRSELKENDIELELILISVYRTGYPAPL